MSVTPLAARIRAAENTAKRAYMPVSGVDQHVVVRAGL